MKIFVINLKRSPQRRSRMEKQLRRLRLDYEIFEATDGQLLGEDEARQYLDRNSMHLPSDKAPNKGAVPYKLNQIGCSLSHYRVYEKIYKDKIPCALIIEDDLTLSDELPAVLSEIEKAHIIPGEVISLYTLPINPVDFYTDSLLSKKVRLIKKCDVQTNDYTPLWGTQGYVIALETAKSFVENILPIRVSVDDWQYYLSNKIILDYKIVFPFPIGLAGEYSDIHETHTGLVAYKALLWKVYKSMINFPVLGNILLKQRQLKEIKARLASMTIDGAKAETMLN